MAKNFHHLEIEETFDIFSTSERGLTTQRAQERLKRVGRNSLPKEESLSSLKIFLAQLKSPLIYFLIIGAIVTFFLKDYTDTIVIMAAVFLNTIIGFFQENKASKALTKLKQALKVSATVLRDGQKKEIFQEDLVPGDIVFLKSGDKVPADARLIEERKLKINESSLTGEHLPVDKKTSTIAESATLGDRQNMVFMGTLVEEGFGRAVVVSTGKDTQVGQIAQLVRETKEEQTPYQKKLTHFGKIITLIIITVSVLVFILGLLTGSSFIEIFTTTVAVAVAAIPEGLPIAMTVVLALGMQRILKRKGLVRKLAAAEALGSTSVICVDKTGTLTEGKMAVGRIVTATGDIIYNQEDIRKKDNTHPEVLALEIANFCAESFVENPNANPKHWILRGRPTDKALISAGLRAGIIKEELERTHPTLEKLEFSSKKKISASLNKVSDKTNILYVMGAPEKILEKSSFLKLDSKNEKLAKENLDDLKEKYRQLAENGLRVLATAYKEYPSSLGEIKDEMLTGLTFVGFIALEDPLRDDAKEMITQAKAAGLKPVIITGDHKLTAQSIALALGLKAKEENILEGEELSKLTDEELKEKVADIEIYARVEPAQKLKIVSAWQARGEVVAMTGDGINDTPAIKKADIGLALGSGTQVAKEVSDIVLLDDNFSVIISSIEEGRSIIDNIRKSIVYLISTSFSEISLIAFSLVLGLPLPILAAQILWVNLVADGLPTIALAYEPKEKDLMQRRPEIQNADLLNKDTKILIFIIGAISVATLIFLFWYLLEFTSYDISRIRSIIFAAVAIITLFYVFSCKSLRKNIWQYNIFSNKPLLFAWFAGVLVLAAAIYVPVLQTLLRTYAISLDDWLIIFSLAVVDIVLIELAKKFCLSREND